MPSKEPELRVRTALSDRETRSLTPEQQQELDEQTRQADLPRLLTIVRQTLQQKGVLSERESSDA